MIGVEAPTADPRVVAEFFELFKTPWEYLRHGRRYDTIVCVGEANIDRSSAKLIVYYADHALPIDREERIEVSPARSKVQPYDGRPLVVYEECLAFDVIGQQNTDTKRKMESWFYRCESNGVAMVRIGYDLFAEVARLLTVGQPAEFASLPTLDLHILVLREAIVDSGIELVEVPPAPDGYGYIACLTHDIDHPAIRKHICDATACGFLYRATAGSLMKFLRGRLPLGLLVKNWIAAIKFPLVFIGLAEDFWEGFENRYFEHEKGIGATYFVIPFRDQPGQGLRGPASRKRAAGYGPEEIHGALKSILAHECEVGLHGIDAWCSYESAASELEEVRKLTQAAQIGVRMHWLFYGEDSPEVLERAGALYDSTAGYRETVGFLNGTTQVYKPIKATRLLELPLHIMDTALFYPTYLSLTQSEAAARVREITAVLGEFGGCLTVNWHDRSFAPERNWESCYSSLLQDLKEGQAWFATATQAAGWFTMRRSVVFEMNSSGSFEGSARVTVTSTKKTPALRLRRHKLDQTGEKSVRRYFDLPFTDVIGENSAAYA
jgi:hypothetical protein